MERGGCINTRKSKIGFQGCQDCLESSMRVGIRDPWDVKWDSGKRRFKPRVLDHVKDTAGWKLRLSGWKSQTLNGAPVPRLWILACLG